MFTKLYYKLTVLCFLYFSLYNVNAQLRIGSNRRLSYH